MSMPPSALKPFARRSIAFRDSSQQSPGILLQLSKAVWVACASAHLASMRKGMSPQRPDLSRTLRSVGWLSIQTDLIGANSSQRATPVIGNHCPWAYCQTRTAQLIRPAGLVSALRASSLTKAGSVSSVTRERRRFFGSVL
jgi:hypothetical protein